MTEFSAPQPWGPYRPDFSEVGFEGTRHVRNMIPGPNGYLPLQAPVEYSDTALGGPVKGAITFKDNSGAVINFAGDRERLYRLVGQNWTDASRTSGGLYTTTATGGWRFVDWSTNLTIATNGADVFQKIDPTGGSNFEPLGGNPPIAKFAAIIANFLVAGNLATDANAVRWSGVFDPEHWVQGEKESGGQVPAGGGRVTGLASGEIGYVFKETRIFEMVRASVPLAFEINPVSEEIGALWQGTIAQRGRQIFFISHQGFQAMAGGELQGIGSNRVDRTFFENFNASLVENVSSAIDPLNKLVFWAYPSKNSSDRPDRLMVFNMTTAEWGEGEVDLDLVRSSFTPGFTLEDLDSVADLDALGISLDSRVWTGGALVMGVFNAAHQLAFFTGQPLAAEIDSRLIDIGRGRRHFTRGVRPFIDTDQATVRMIRRERLADDEEDLGASAMNENGVCPQFAEARYSRYRMEVPAGAAWTSTEGFEADIDGNGSE